MTSFGSRVVGGLTLLGVTMFFQNCGPGLQMNEILAGGDIATVNYNVSYQRRALGDDMGATSASSMTAEALMARLKFRGCVFDGLLSEDIGADFDGLLARSACAAVPRAIETWANPPDFAKIQSRLAQIARQTNGRSFDFGMFVAEAISLRRTYLDEAGRPYDFRAMCKEGTIGQWGADTCVPHVAKPEYRRYLRHITRRAVDLGIRNILFGQTGHQDPGYELGAVLADIRDYARSREKIVLIGQQPNGMQPESYLKTFDFIVGPVYVDIDTSVSPCLNLGGGCQAVLHHPDVVGRAHNVIAEIDWASVDDDDTHRFARKSASERHAFLSRTAAELRARGVGFFLPFRTWLTGDTSGKNCYGVNEWVYSPHRDFGCKDEDHINQILNGRDGVPAAAATSTGPAFTKDEARGIVLRGFTEILGRQPAEAEADSAGLQYWMDRLIAGLQETRFRELLAASDEKFVRDLYRSVLGRTAAMSEVQFYLAELASGRSRDQVRADLQYACDNGVNGECGGGSTPKPTPTPSTVAPDADLVAIVKSVFRQYLERTTEDLRGDVAGINYWVNRMKAGLTQTELVRHIVASDEYFVRQAYKTHLGRSAATSEVQWWTGELSAGRKTRDALVKDFKYACQNHLQGECQR